ncbi:MAG TPA: OB-fold domain-containing protein [Acidimicrobiia bacterium]|nr:OB-fold domain-containing protein [Acidimicrobiia bacterium]
MAIKRDDFPLPDIDDPLTAPFFAGAARGRLLIPRCEKCGEYVWYPQTACPRDGAATTWTPVSGRGTLFTWAVVTRAFLPAFEDRVPFVTALVELVEDPAVRLCTYLVDASPDRLTANARVAVSFRPLEFTTVPGKSVVVPMFALA